MDPRQQRISELEAELARLKAPGYGVGDRVVLVGTVVSGLDHDGEYGIKFDSNARIYVSASKIRGLAGGA
jgi:hypothetical protein